MGVEHTDVNEETHEAAILRTRAYSNRSIAKRNLLGVADSLAEDYIGIVGDGSFVPSRAEYLRLFKEGFDSARQSVTYVRTPASVTVSQDQRLAAENGSWTATLPSGSLAFNGTYAAMWRRTPTGWKIRSEMFVTLTS